VRGRGVRLLSRLRLHLGALDDDPQCPPRGHIYVGSKAPWYEIHDSLPRFDEMPSAEFQAELLREIAGGD
jgi:hypothetical protein